MKVKVILLKKYMKQKEMSPEKLASVMDVKVSEVEKMLNGEVVTEDTAIAFIEYLGADKAQELIDWEAIGKQNPFACNADKEE